MIKDFSKILLNSNYVFLEILKTLIELNNSKLNFSKTMHFTLFVVLTTLVCTCKILCKILVILVKLHQN